MSWTPAQSLIDDRTAVDLVYPSELVVGDLHYPVRTVFAGDPYNDENGCVLRSVTIPDSVERIGYGSPYYTGSGSMGIGPWDMATLQTINIGAGLSDLGGMLFSFQGYVPHLIHITVSEKNPYFTAVDDVIYSKDMKTIAFVQPSKINSDGTFTIPDTVTNIGAYCFNYNKMLTKIVIPAGVTEIEDFAFNDLALVGETTLEFAPGSKLKKIGNYAFSGARLSGTVTIPNSVTEMGEGAFSYCTAETVIMPENLEVIPERCFYSSDTLTYVFPKNLKVIEKMPLWAASAAASPCPTP